MIVGLEKVVQAQVNMSSLSAKVNINVPEGLCWNWYLT